jgi:uncharacterized SAM-binding protein YcdF (DUF218 family)
VLLFAPIRWALKLVYFAVLAAVVYLVVSGFQVVFASHLPTGAASARKARAIVVLGAPVVNGSPGPDLTARLRQTLRLFDASRGPKVVVVGEAASPGVGAETTVARDWLVARGVPASSVATVTAPDASTGLTKVKSIPGVGVGDGTSVIIVTDAIDALWTNGAASKAGLSAQVSPALGSEKAVYEELGALWRQATGVAVGRLIGYGHATWAAH